MASRNIRLTAPDGAPINGADYAGDFDAAEKAGSFRIGRTAFYYRDGLRRRCVPYAGLDSVAVESEAIDTHCCCCSVGLAVYHLILRGGEGKLADIRLEDERLALRVQDRLNAALTAARSGTPAD